MTVINKGALVDALAAHMDKPKAEAARFLDGFIDVVSANLKKGNDIGITGFGSFKTGKRAARTGRNPANGETIKIAASKTVRFAAGATLKSTLNPPKKK